MRDEFISDVRLFEPDAMLPAQFFATLRAKPPAGPEYLLAAAVLEDAIDCFQKHCEAPDSRMRRLYEDAEEWMASDDREWPFSYVNICELLGLQPDYLREGLRAWKENRRRQRNRASHSVASAHADRAGRTVRPFTGGCGRRASKLN
jgi:hypothetical protein